jgi:hypothetical protein
MFNAMSSLGKNVLALKQVKFHGVYKSKIGIGAGFLKGSKKE